MACTRPGVPVLQLFHVSLGNGTSPCQQPGAAPWQGYPPLCTFLLHRSSQGPGETCHAPALRRGSVFCSRPRNHMKGSRQTSLRRMENKQSADITAELFCWGK